MIKQYHLHVWGDVIGVGFRAWTKIQAKVIGITGWVKNTGDEVEAVVQGDEEKVDKMIGLLKKGPPVSMVDAVETVEETVKEIFDEFEIKK